MTVNWKAFAQRGASYSSKKARERHWANDWKLWPYPYRASKKSK